MESQVSALSDVVIDEPSVDVCVSGSLSTRNTANLDI